MSRETTAVLPYHPERVNVSCMMCTGCRGTGKVPIDRSATAVTPTRYGSCAWCIGNNCNACWWGQEPPAVADRRLRRDVVMRDHMVGGRNEH